MRYAEYVGARQWAALLKAEQEYPHPVRVSVLNEAVARAITHHNSRGAVESLIGAGMLRHSCLWDDHTEGPECLLVITQSGRNARLNRRGRAAAGASR